VLAAGGLIAGVALGQHLAAAPVGAATAPVVPVPQSDLLREQAIATADAAIVRVNNVGQGLGSGVTISPTGNVVTNYHVVAGATRLTVTLADGHTLPATLLGTDPVDDIAVVKIAASRLPTAAFGSSASLRLGQTVLAIGNPLGIGTTVTDGIVSALNRTVDEGQNGPQTTGSILNAIQTSAAINPGNSGGALINLAGQVVGIPTLAAVDPEFNAPASGVGFAIPSTTVQSIAGQIIADGRVVHSGRSYLGVSSVPVTPQTAQQANLPVSQGVAIAAVSAGGPAAKAGLQVGDVIVGLGSRTIATYDDLLQALATTKPGQTVAVRVLTSQNQPRTVRVTLSEFPIPSQH